MSYTGKSVATASSTSVRLNGFLMIASTMPLPIAALKASSSEVVNIIIFRPGWFSLAFLAKVRPSGFGRDWSPECGCPSPTPFNRDNE